MGSRKSPRWTRSRAKRVLTLCTSPTGTELDTAAAAQLVGRSRRTVQRWLHGHPNSLVPPAARQVLIDATGPTDQTLRREEYASRYARQAVERRSIARGKTVLTEWKEQGWLDEHLVMLLSHPAARLLQVASAKFSTRQLREMRRRGTILDVTTVAGRFEATLLVNRTLELVGPWRVRIAPSRVRQGATQVWLADAPAVNLDQLAVTAGLRTPPS